MKKSFNRGFTLIELLVVVAIIGILSGIVLTSLNSARGKANEAATKANLQGARTAAEVYYTDKGNYDGICGSGSGTWDASLSGYQSKLGTSALCYASDQKFAVSATLDTGGTWCIDSDGYNDAGVATSAGTCDDSTSN